MKDYIILIGNSISLGKNNINNKANEDDTLLSDDLLNQLMKARNIISVLLPEKQNNLFKNKIIKLLIIRIILKIY